MKFRDIIKLKTDIKNIVSEMPIELNEVTTAEAERILFDNRVAEISLTRTLKYILFFFALTLVISYFSIYYFTNSAVVILFSIGAMFFILFIFVFNVGLGILNRITTVEFHLNTVHNELHKTLESSCE